MKNSQYGKHLNKAYKLISKIVKMNNENRKKKI